ncbi:hypothetical protein [Curtobacterium sp. GD1]|uniref:hypothetical protein n=1 Tax=Curtobacterium sp. GD1 TaxID=2810612 RepID=UPI001E3D4264|nr:hypothetical protein [Curtobacterium sp. GD1]MCC8906413.1 hypothetical protein [Curtobacterium sp. GD1]
MTARRIDEEALRQLTVDGPTARRRQLMRELDRLVRHPFVDEELREQILADAEVRDWVQRERRPH